MPKKTPFESGLPCSKITKKVNVHRIGALSLAEGSPFFTPISSTCFDSDADTSVLESLCKIVGYSDSLDAIRVENNDELKHKIYSFV